MRNMALKKLKFNHSKKSITEALGIGKKKTKKMDKHLFQLVRELPKKPMSASELLEDGFDSGLITTKEELAIYAMMVGMIMERGAQAMKYQMAIENANKKSVEQEGNAKAR